MLHVDQTSPGGWLAATAPGRLVVVRAASEDAALPERLWTALAGSIQSVLDVLTSGGLASTPAFVLAEWSGDADRGFSVRFIVRGSARVQIDSDGGRSSIDASDASTWLEQPVSAVRAFRVDCDGDSDSASILLPLGLGAAWVRSVSFGGDRRALDAEADLAAADLPVAVDALPAPEGPDASAASAASDGRIAEATVVEPFEVDARAEPEPPATAVLPVASAAPTGYDHLFGATVVRFVEAAAVRPADAENADTGSIEADAEGDADADSDAETGNIADDLTAMPASSNPAAPNPASSNPAAPTPSHTIAPPPFITESTGSLSGDHDGFTVLSGDIDALRASSPSAAATLPPPAHSAPPAASAFYLRLAGGAREPLTGTVIVGRAPSVSKVPGTRVPHLITVDTPDHDISRNHVQFALEGDTVVVTDLHSRNGTMIVLPGKSPQKLRQGEPTSVIVGTVVDLGGGVTLTVGQS